MAMNLQNKISDKLYNLLKEMNSVTKHFESDTTTVAEVRAFLNVLNASNPSTQGTLNLSANFIFNSTEALRDARSTVLKPD